MSGIFQQPQRGYRTTAIASGLGSTSWNRRRRTFWEISLVRLQRGFRNTADRIPTTLPQDKSPKLLATFQFSQNRPAQDAKNVDRQNPVLRCKTRLRGAGARLFAAANPACYNPTRAE